MFPDLSGTVVVHDRYVNYDSFTDISHQLCTAHLLRDLEDAAQACPDAIWPGQAADALRALIHQANLARAHGLDAIPDEAIAGHLTLFRHGIRAGLSEVRRVPGSNEKQPPSRLLLECLRNREHDVLRFLTDLSVPPTSNGAERDVRPAKTQQKISGGFAPSTPPATATPSAATCPPPPSTAAASSPPSSAPSPETPGCRPSPRTPEPRAPAVTQRNQISRECRDLNVYSLVPSAFGYNEASFRFHEGNAYTHLHDFRSAMRAQDLALQLCAPDNYADWAMTRLDRAQCLIYAGDITSGLEYASETITTINPAQRRGIITLRGRDIVETLPEGERDAGQPATSGNC